MVNLVAVYNLEWRNLVAVRSSAPSFTMYRDTVSRVLHGVTLVCYNFCGIRCMICF